MLTKQGSMLLKSNDSCYISCGCNRTPHCMDWGENNLICYGACHSVAIYDPKEGGGGRVLVTLNGHKGRVNSVRWIKASNPHVETELVSVSSDATAIVWTLDDGEFKPSAKLTGNSESLNVVDALYMGNNLDGKYAVTYIATASADSTVNIWQKKEASFTCIEKFKLGSGGVCLSLVLIHLSGHDTPLLACGNDDCKIHLYSSHNKLITLVGHEDWIRTIDFTTDENGDVLLASGSQDTTVRLWRISKNSYDATDCEEFRQEEQSIVVDGSKWIVILESILCGHEGWVYGVHWHPKVKNEKGWMQPAMLLSCSLDRTIVMWAPEEETGVWLEKVRVGELGGNTLGYYGSRFGPSGKSVLGHSFQGAFHMWHKSNDRWSPGVTVGGHFGGVSDIGWESEGRYLLSVSSDQTTRLHAPWVNGSASSCNWSWHEMCRPQIHGYDMFCLAVLPKFTFVSGSEEKIARVFTAPQNSLQNLNALTKLPIGDFPLEGIEGMPCGAAVPALGLSNKAVFSETQPAYDDGDKHHKDEYSDVSFTAQYLNEPGSEDYLVQNSLWPEVMKLYGHGYEVFSLAGSHSGDFLASACKATTQEHAKIILWNTKTWEKIQELIGHQLTVTQMAFSPDDTHLLSVSRDRRWCLFRILEDKMYHLVAYSEKGNGIHTRIIWTCSWTHDSKYFATGSREGKLVVWGRTEQSGLTIGEYSASSAPLLLKDAVTAVCFAHCPILNTKGYLLAVGEESSIIQCYIWNPTSDEPWRALYKIDELIGHHLSIERLAFRPVLGKTGDYNGETNHILQLASCSLDCSVRVYNINLEVFTSE